MQTVERRLFFDREVVDGADALISKFEARSFASPFRSTVPLLALVKDGWPVFKRILSLCNLRGDVSLHFEFRVRSPKGSGRSSHTDAMVLSESTALAMEAKWTEPRYQSVSARLKRKESDSSDPREFLEGWLDLLRPYATTPLRLDDFSDAVYQVLHRAASACAISRSPTLAYLHFTPAGAPGAAGAAQYRADLLQVRHLLGNPPGFPFYLVEVPIMPTSAFTALEHLRKGLPETDLAVRSALASARLFEFGEPQVETINGPAESGAGTVK